MTTPFSELLNDLEHHLTETLVPAVDKSWLPIVFEIVQSARNGRYNPSDTVLSPSNIEVRVGQVVQFFKLEKFLTN